MRRGGSTRLARASSQADATGRRSSPSRGRGVTTSTPSCSTTPARVADPRRSGIGASAEQQLVSVAPVARWPALRARHLRRALPRHPVALRLEERQRLALRAPARDGHARRAVRQHAQHVLPRPRVADQLRRERPEAGPGRRERPCTVRRQRRWSRCIEHEAQLRQQRLHAGSSAAASSASTSASTSALVVQAGAIAGSQEALGDGRVEEGQEAAPVVADLEEADRLGVQAELRPGQDLAQLVEGAHAAGQHQEGVGERRHQRLALVHAADDAEVGDAAVRQLALDHRRRDDAGHAAALRQHGVRGDPHQPDVGPAIHQLAPASRQRAAERGRRLGVGRVVAGARAAEDRDPGHGRSIRRSERRLESSHGQIRVAHRRRRHARRRPRSRRLRRRQFDAQPARRSHRRRRQGLRREGRRRAARPEPPAVAGAVGVVELHHQRHRGDLGQHLPAVHRRDDEDGQGRDALRRGAGRRRHEAPARAVQAGQHPAAGAVRSGQAGRADQARRRPRSRLRPRQVLPARQAVPGHQRAQQDDGDQPQSGRAARGLARLARRSRRR